jgi:hypothetical protein
MKGFLTKCVTALCVTSGLAVVGGCDCYRNLVDPCYPERYEYASRQEVVAAFAPQVTNGHFLDQTVWNYHFELGTDRLTLGGMEHLTYLARRRPYPDCTIYLATAHDIVYEPAAADKYAEQRVNLDRKRIQAIQNYLVAETAGRHVSFEVVVHDPAELGLAGQPMAISVARMVPSFQGSLAAPGGAGTTGGGAPPGGAALGGAPPGGAAPGGAPAGGAGGGAPR